MESSYSFINRGKFKQNHESYLAKIRSLVNNARTLLSGDKCTHKDMEGIGAAQTLKVRKYRFVFETLQGGTFELFDESVVIRFGEELFYAVFHHDQFFGCVFATYGDIVEFRVNGNGQITG